MSKRRQSTVGPTSTTAVPVLYSMTLEYTAHPVICRPDASAALYKTALQQRRPFRPLQMLLEWSEDICMPAGEDFLEHFWFQIWPFQF